MYVWKLSLKTRQWKSNFVELEIPVVTPHFLCLNNKLDYDSRTFIFGPLKLVSRQLKLVNNVSKTQVQIPKHTFLSPVITCRLLKTLKGNYKVTVFTSHSEQHIYPSVETHSPNSTQQTVIFEPTAPQSYLSSTE